MCAERACRVAVLFREDSFGGVAASKGTEEGQGRDGKRELT
jgi:hypothetical protein